MSVDRDLLVRLDLPVCPVNLELLDYLVWMAPLVIADNLVYL